MPHQKTTLPVLRGTTTSESAIGEEEDMFLDLDYPEQRIELFVLLYGNRGDIEDCAISPWPKSVRDLPAWRRKRRGTGQLQRESKYPGNVDEKLRCEAAASIWIKEHCPELPTPQLWGFELLVAKVHQSSTDYHLYLF
ncbi:hypothetical protein BDV27DRAFT_155660 [Aspergillus caelatus]|uniref:Uncharacterized protein n=1 Tax=Aspergillus caelatus TaxID=61420 RepID=A0A5N7ACI4_9EURO|nr:uncharacterized protein BDV27DRAFT_155660 [Aspergillus caelatus]KAE8366769.1 hypothetical protein BDV27DRAFT_155660 [Aspergillus caelatus]